MIGRLVKAQTDHKLRTGLAGERDRVFFAEFPVFQYPLYRYCRIEHFEEFMSSGRIRLGTLWGYRDIERLGSLVGDDFEGLSAGFGSYSGIPVLAGGFALNAWVLCMSSRMNPRMYSDFNANCCFQIEEIGFFHEISMALSHTYRYGSVGPMDYWNPQDVAHQVGRQMVRGDGAKIVFANIKRPKYKYQHEVRGIWEPWTAELEKKRIDAEERFRAGEAESQTIGTVDGYLIAAREMMKADHAFPNLQPVFVEVPEARKFVRLVEAV